MKRLSTFLVLVATALALPGGLCAAQSSGDYYFNKAHASHRSGRLQEAVLLYTKAIESDNRNVMAYQMRGAASQKLGHLKRALYDYTMVIRLGEPLFKAVGYYNRGVVKSMSRRYAEAIEDFTAALEIDQRMASAYFHRAIARLKTGDGAGAFEDFRQAARRGDPDAERWLDATAPGWRDMK